MEEEDSHIHFFVNKIVLYFISSFSTLSEMENH